VAKYIVAACAVLLAGVLARSALQPPAAQPVRRAAAPAAATPEARGRLVYASYGCSLCHGDDGKSGRENLNAETDGRVPAVVYVAEGYTETEVAQLIRTGTPHIGRTDPGGPTPPYRMPGFGGVMTDREVRDLVRYLMSLMPRDAADSWR
jgi:mono/diheme cytochrome c family protein